MGMSKVYTFDFCVFLFDLLSTYTKVIKTP